jgi:hypothetical protein
MKTMAAEDVDREEQWFKWAMSTFGGNETRSRAAARAADAVQRTGAGFETAATAARAAYTDASATRSSDRAPWEKAAPEVESSKPHLSPDGRWFWDGHEWTASNAKSPALAQTPVLPPPASSQGLGSFSQGLSSWVSGATSENLFYGQAVIVWARWILIATGLVLSFWEPASLGLLQIQLAAIITLAFGNFYLHVQLLRGRPAIDRVVYAASAADLAVVTTLVISQNGYSSPVFVFYFAAVLGLSVAFPTVLTALYTSAVVVVYGIVCLSTADSAEYPAVFTRLLMIAAIALCGALFARSEAHRRAEALQLHESENESGSTEDEVSSAAGEPEPVPVGAV